MGRPHPAVVSRSRLFFAGLLASLVVVLMYKHASCLADLARSATSQWQPIRSNVEAARKRQSQPLDLARDDAFEPKPRRRDMTPLSRRVSTRRKRALVDPATGTAAGPVAITAALPSTDSLSQRFISTYDGFFNSLTASAEALLAEKITPELAKRAAGVPGTGISSAKEAESLQAYLDCVASTGEWVHDPRGTSLAGSRSGLTVHKQESRHAACDKRYYKASGASTSDASGSSTRVPTSEWNVRESLKWTWHASPTCEALAPSSLLRSSAARSSRSHLPSRRRLCELLARKSTLLLGDTTQYSLHDLVLDWTTVRPQSCYGDLYCMQHVLCEDVLAVPEGRAHEVENWEVDDRIYHRLPFPPTMPPGGTKLQVGRAIDASSETSGRPDGDGEASSTMNDLAKRGPSIKEGDALLRYRRTDGLRPARSQTRPLYRAPPTDVREYNQQWLADARRSDLVILNKAPLPLPREGFNSTFDAWVRDFTAQSNGAASVEERALRVVEAAREVTELVWLPELVEALKAIRAPPSPADVLALYRGGWRQHADCAAASLGVEATARPPTSAGDGPPPHLSPPTLASLLMRRSPSSDELELQPLHIAYHNTQLVFQNHLARTVILPAFRIPFLDLETPLSIWRSGMVGSSVASPFQALLGAHGGQTVLSPAGRGLRSPASGDCTRYCFPSPGLAIERFFLGSMATILEAGWAGSTEREQAWVGNGFTTLKDRVGSRV